MHKTEKQLFPQLGTSKNNFDFFFEKIFGKKSEKYRKRYLSLPNTSRWPKTFIKVKDVHFDHLEIERSRSKRSLSILGTKFRLQKNSKKLRETSKVFFQFLQFFKSHSTEKTLSGPLCSQSALFLLKIEEKCSV